MSFPTLAGDGVPGFLLIEPQVCLGVAYANSQYNFFVAGTSYATPVDVYQDAALATPYPNKGIVNADSFGRFPPIYLDGAVLYGVQFFNSGNVQVWQIDPYTPPLSTRGTSGLAAFGVQISAFGEVIVPAPAAGGTQVTMKLTASAGGLAPLQVSSPLAGQPAVAVSTSAIGTGIQNALFTATTKPGTTSGLNNVAVSLLAVPTGAAYVGGTLVTNWLGATNTNYTVTTSTGQAIVNCTLTNGSTTFTCPSTVITGTPTVVLQVSASTPAGWLPLTIDGVLMYTPIWHGNAFSPYVANPAANGEIINAISIKFSGDGTTAPPPPNTGTAFPGNWYTPTTAAIGAGYYINVVKTGGLSGLVAVAFTSATVAPSGAAYVGGTLIAPWIGTTAANYTIQLNTGQIISGCTFTNASTAFVTPSTVVNATPTVQLLVGPAATSWLNISGTGVIIGANAAAQYNANYSLSTSLSGTPVVASGTIQFQGVTVGQQSPTYNGQTPLILASNGGATLNGVGSSNWFGPNPTVNAGANAWVNITRSGGTSGVNFSAAQGAWTSLLAGLTIDLTGTGNRNATGTYQLSANAAGTLIVGQGTITLTATGAQNTNWSGTAPLVLAGNGTSTLGGIANTNWYLPTTTNIGSGYWINITRTSGTTGVSFSAAQGAWTNITNGGLSVSLSGTSGNVGTATSTGTYQLSSSATGTPVLGSGTITLNVTGLSVIHVYTSGTSATETILTGTTNVAIEIWGSGGGGAGGTGSGCVANNGTGGAAGGYSRSSYTAAALGGVGKTFKYTIGAAGTAGPGGGSGGNGGAGTVVAGTVGGFATMTGNGGGGGANGPGGTGGTATGGTQANTTGASTAARAQGGATGTSGTLPGDGSPYGGGGRGGFPGVINPGVVGLVGAAVFRYT